MPTVSLISLHMECAQNGLPTIVYHKIKESLELEMVVSVSQTNLVDVSYHSKTWVKKNYIESILVPIPSFPAVG